MAEDGTFGRAAGQPGQGRRDAPNGRRRQSDLLHEAPAHDFVSDAFQHLKYVAYVDAAMPLMRKAGVADDMDEGFVGLESGSDAAGFVKACRNLRLWIREPKVHGPTRFPQQSELLQMAGE